MAGEQHVTGRIDFHAWGWAAEGLDVEMVGGMRGRMVKLHIASGDGQVSVGVPMQRADWELLKKDVDAAFSAVHVAQRMPESGGQG